MGMTPHHVTQSPRRVIKSSHTGVTASITASANNQLSSVGCDVPLNNVFGTNFTALFPMSETAPADCAVMQTIWPQLKTTRPFNATNCCSTSGITCLGGAITVIELFDTSATGVIPSDFSKLTKLQTLSLYNNQLTGTIPPSLGQISALRFLSIHHNQLNGSIPSSLGQLSSLVGLYLDSNQLTGPIPSTLGDLKSLEGIQLDNNKLSGSVPPELGKIKFNGIYLDNNPDLKGPLPAEWGSLNLGSVCTRGAEASTASQFYCCNLGNLCSAAGTQRPLHCGPSIEPDGSNSMC
ncbi:hypothetical protein EDD86DRAFT_53558 [Gorgonomyces haynaldii]|nr:hypothetical protein EDD86DRAFT_53558 [Gorgonomyces haynaldii]